MNGENIRKDFAAAMRSVKHGSELSRPLDFAFSKQDILTLAELHKANRFRRKIEDLLEDCNFHTECLAMARGDYSMFTDAYAP